MDHEKCVICGEPARWSWFYSDGGYQIPDPPKDLVGSELCNDCYCSNGGTLATRIRAAKQPQATPMPTINSEPQLEQSVYSFFASVSNGYCACNIPRHQCDYHR